VSPFFELRTKFPMVVDFPVEDKDNVIIFRDHRLFATVTVNDSQAPGAQRYAIALPNSLFIRTAMN
jgi:hypothetical protein